MRMFVSSPSKLMVLLILWLIQISCAPSPLHSMWRDLPTALWQKFKMVFVNKSVEYTYQDATGGSSLALMSSSDVLLKIKETSCAAVAISDHLQLGKKRNLPGKHANNSVIVPKCDSCGNPNHLSPKCPKPHDEEKCKKAWEAWKNATQSVGGKSGQVRGGQDGCGSGAGRGSGSDGQRAP